jgi:glycosyltransferase involved in cell wall biosynthesis
VGAARRRVGDDFVPPWEASVVQDVALNRPLNLVFRVLRAWVRVRATELVPGLALRPGATVAIVNWNSADLLVDVLRAIETLSPPGTEVIVVDNGSADGSAALLRARRGPGLRVVLLPTNVFHGPAMDLAFLLSRTRYVIALDVDAFPIAPGWVEQLTAPLERGFAVVGAEAARGYVHPCCLAMRLDRFAAMRHTFTPHVGDWDPEKLGGEEWDTGESITRREGLDRASRLPRTRVRGPLQLGSVFGDLVYHCGASTRLRADTRIDGLTLGDAQQAWAEAVAEYLGPDTGAREADAG